MFRACSAEINLSFEQNYRPDFGHDESCFAVKVNEFKIYFVEMISFCFFFSKILIIKNNEQVFYFIISIFT
ncbi:hypothetical protein DBB36_10770 [Flavobacterium sp. WLB]|nr:hypothetical protein AKO67_13055 [Flavobacterium sp. VMW]OWU90964.1 hypothetical protein APR43_10845 [Flavobacterium sp. NLM]PUU70028.1 hypothetical protein DBB36_10770 [Flavobacterium sp. WLB]